jgi:hypothetical protein
MGMKLVAFGRDQAVPPQFGLINLLKAGAAQLIVLHHLAFYGPMSDHLRPILPSLMDWLGSSARIAVQVFLVISGFLAAKSLSPSGHHGLSYPLLAIWRRYAKLALPFMVATLLAAVASALAASWMTHDSISAPATLSQLAAHALLLHGVLGYPSLSAGAWYVAIDFQLYAAVILMLWLTGRLAGSRRLTWLMPFVVALAVTFSLMHFNLDSGWDNWAPYFFGSYGLGMLAWWASDPRRKSGGVGWLLVMALVPAAAALTVDFRSRRRASASAPRCLVADDQAHAGRRGRCVSAEDAGKFPDTNIAESLQRVTGVQIQRNNGEGRYISVRGLGPEFNNVLVNGRTMTSDTGGREFSFDLLSSDLISKALVYKTSQPFLPEGGIGSTVDIQTARPLSGKVGHSRRSSTCPIPTTPTPRRTRPTSAACTRSPTRPHLRRDRSLSYTDRASKQ